MPTTTIPLTRADYEAHAAYVDRLRVMHNATYYNPWRIALRRLIAYLAVRWDPAWLTASPDVLEAWLPRQWATLHHHELVAYLADNHITPEHCTLA